MEKDMIGKVAAFIVLGFVLPAIAIGLVLGFAWLISNGFVWIFGVLLFLGWLISVASFVFKK